MESDDGMITKINEGKYDNMIDGKYEKTVHVKTWNDKMIIAKMSSAKGGHLDEANRRKKHNSGRPPTSREPRRVLMDKKEVERI